MMTRASKSFQNESELAEATVDQQCEKDRLMRETEMCIW